MKKIIILSALGLLALMILLITPMIGMEFIPFSTLWTDPESMNGTILRDIRIPRTLTGFLVGSALALSGMTFQAMFRNPLATPFTLGTASGARSEQRCISASVSPSPFSALPVSPLPPLPAVCWRLVWYMVSPE